MFDKEEIRKIIAKLGLYFVILSFLLMIDLISKQIVFDSSSIGDGNSWGIIGGRSIANHGTTVLNNIGLTLSQITLIIFSIGMFIFTSFIAAFTEKRITVIAMAILGAGILGNGVDRIAFGFVRDIVYIPGGQNGNAGTFNFADVFVVSASITWALHVLIELGTSDEQNNKKVK